nr:MAG: ORF1 [Anelloviridae sp.]
MPWYPRRRYPRRRYRWLRRWRARRPFRPRYRRRYWVRNYSRKRKLFKITEKQWQPKVIRKTHVKGTYPLFLCTKHRINNNMIQYLDSIAPEHYYGGGGFSIMQFSLQALYEEFIKAKNWWTNTNCFLPLVRYMGCSFKFYKTEYYDYIVLIERCYPLACTDEMYLSSQPSIMMLTKKCIFVPCKQNSKGRKPYKRVKVRPPSQMTTGWHFSQDLANMPLVVLKTSVCSFDRYYTDSTAKSTTIGFKTLNTQTFRYHDWQDPPTTGYKPQNQLWFYGAENGSPVDPNNTVVSNLIYLGGTGPYEKGTPIKTTIQTYFSEPKLWGNIFHDDYTSGTSPVFVTNKTPSEIKNMWPTIKDQTVKASNVFTLRTIPLWLPCRYNPFADKATNNKIWLVSIHSDHTEWKPIDNPLLQRNDLPLWLLVWGWQDWQKKNQQTSQPDINYLTVISSPYISCYPKLDYYVLLDDSFWDGHSTYIETITDSDKKHWYPKNRFQIETLNLIANTGPGTVKLRENQAAEGHMVYRFNFKLGGCPAPMEKICDPSKQSKYPIPNNQQQTTSLQSPENPIQTYLYDFDERRGLLTERATKRIKQDHTSEKTVLPFTGAATDLPILQTTSQEESSSEEEEEQQAEKKLLQLRRKQHRLRQRILQLLDIQNT